MFNKEAPSVSTVLMHTHTPAKAMQTSHSLSKVSMS